MDRDGTGVGYDLARCGIAGSRAGAGAARRGRQPDHLVDGVRSGPRQRRPCRLDLPFRRIHDRRAKAHMAAAGLPMRMDAASSVPS
jgi:cyclase